MKTINQHFKGKALLEALRCQEIFQHCPNLADRVAKNVKVRNVPKGAILIRDGSGGKDVFLILRGCFDIKIGNQRVNSRSENEHVGEMAALRGGRRTATVVASENSTVAQISGKDFERLSASEPCIWKNVARILAKRLDQRRGLLREPNETPHIFLASSTEGKGVAAALKMKLAGIGEVRSWADDRVFTASSITVNRLLNESQRTDFAVAILSADDELVLRKRRMKAARDNVIFEAGLFVGAIGLDRTFLLSPAGYNIRIPSDLAGVTLLGYTAHQRTGRIEVTKAAEEICECIAELKCR